MWLSKSFGRYAKIENNNDDDGDGDGDGDGDDDPCKNALTAPEPLWDDILTPLYIDPGVNISYDILTPGSIYRNDILTPLTIYWPPSKYAI